MKRFFLLFYLFFVFIFSVFGEKYNDIFCIFNGKSISSDYEMLKEILDDKKLKISEKTLCVFKFFDLYGWDLSSNSLFYELKKYLPFPCGDKKMGFCYYDETYMVKKKYTKCYDFSYGFAKVEINRKYGFIDRYGKEVIPLKYDEVSDFKNGFAVVKIKSKYGVIDINGNEILELKYDKIYGPFNGVFAFMLDNKWGIVSKDGSIVVSPIYDLVFLKDPIIVKKDNKYGVIDLNGNILSQPQYDYIGEFSNGYSVVKKNGRYGLIDTKAKEIIKPKYEDIGYCDEYSNYVGLGKKKVDHCLFTSIFKDGFAPVKINKKWGIIDINGNEIIKPQYDEIIYYEKDLVKAIINNKLIDIKISNNDILEQK